MPAIIDKKAHLETINRLLECCPETAEFLRKCDSCFIDVRPEIKKNEEQRAWLDRVKAEFYPEEP